MVKRIVSSFLVAVMLLSVLPLGVMGAAENKNQVWNKQTLFDEFASGKELDRTYPWNLGGSSTGSSSFSQLVDNPTPKYDGDKAIRLKSSSGYAASQASFDCNLGEATGYTTDMYVSTSILADKDTKVAFKIFGFEKGKKKESKLFTIKDGKFYIMNGENEEDVNTEIPLSKWSDLYVTIELEQRTFSVSVDGETIVNEEGDEAFKLPYKYKSIYKTGFYSAGANSLTYLDDFYFATLDAPAGAESAEESEKSKSSLDKWENNIGIITTIMTDRLIMVEGSPKFFNNMVPAHYDEADSAIYPVIRGESYIVPAKAVAENLGLAFAYNEQSQTVTLSKDGVSSTMTVGSTDAQVAGSKVTLSAAPEMVNGTLFVPANEIALAAGKKIYTDATDTGLIIIGATAKPFNSRKKMDVKSEVARATRYERPDPERVMADFAKTPRASQHPRIFITKDRIEEIKVQIKTDEFLQKAYEGIKKDANKKSKKALPKFHSNYGGNGTANARYWDEDIMPMMMVYWIDGEEKYLQKSIDIAMALADFPEYGPVESLSAAEAAVSLAVAYDWLYDYLTVEQREKIKEAIVEKRMKEDLLKYKKLHPLSHIVSHGGWVDWGNNFTTNGNEGVMSTIAVMWDEEPELCKELLRYFFRSMETVFEELLPDGGGREGIGYLVGGSIAESLNAFMHLVDLAGTDYNYLHAKQYKDALESHIYLAGSEGRFIYADDNRSPVVNGPEFLWVGKYMSPMTYEYRLDTLERYPEDATFFVTDMIDYDPNYVPSFDDRELGKMYRKSEAAGFRNSWQKEFNTFVGFKGGDSVMSHSHRDLGSFVFESNGVRWFGDHGMIFYLYTNKSARGNMAYNHRAEGHNVLMFRSIKDLTEPPASDADGMIPLDYLDMEDIPIGGTPSWETSIKDGSKLEVVQESDGNKALLFSSDSTGFGQARMSYNFLAGLITDGFTLEYDMKINHMESESARITAMYTQPGEDYSITTSNGFRFMQLATPTAYDGYEYEKEEWFHVKTVYDLSTNTYDMWIDGKQLHKGKSIGITAGHNPCIIQFETGAADIEYMIDNLKFSLANNDHNFVSVAENKRTKDDQSLSAVSKVQNFTNGEGAGFASVDLSAVYPDYTKDYQRAVGLFNNREVLVIRDEATVLKDCETWWFGHTVQDIKVSADGKSAILTEPATGKRLWVGIMTDGPEKFTTMLAEPFPESPRINGEVAEGTFAGKEKLTIETARKAGDKIELTIMMTPIYKGQDAPAKLPEVKPIAEWTDEPYTGARLPGILINGVPLEDFDPAQVYYEKVYTRYDIDPPLASIPKVSVPEGVNAVITQAQTVGDTATITVGEGADARTYYVAFDEIVEIYIDPASIPVFEPPYEPTGKMLNAGDYMIAQDSTRRGYGFDTVASVYQLDYWFDGNVDTNHSVAPLPEKEGEIEAFEDIDLGQVVPVSALEIIFANGLKRQDMFSLYASVDGENWEIVLSENASSGQSRDWEKFSFPTIQTRWLRIVSHGNTGGSRFCNMSELRIRK